ncbi:MAG: hypothetical protein AAFP86_01005 [Planctomycetota bacterium]
MQRLPALALAAAALSAAGAYLLFGTDSSSATATVHRSPTEAARHVPEEALVDVEETQGRSNVEPVHDEPLTPRESVEEAHFAELIRQLAKVPRPLPKVRVVSAIDVPLEHLEFREQPGGAWKRVDGFLVPMSDLCEVRAAGHPAQLLSAAVERSPEPYRVRADGARGPQGPALFGEFEGKMVFVPPATRVIEPGAVLRLVADGLGEHASAFDLETRFGPPGVERRRSVHFATHGDDAIVLIADVERWNGAGPSKGFRCGVELSGAVSLEFEWDPYERTRRTERLRLSQDWIQPKTAEIRFDEIGVPERRWIKREAFVSLDGNDTLQLVESANLTVRAQLGLKSLRTFGMHPGVVAQVPVGLGSASVVLRRRDGVYGRATFSPGEPSVSIPMHAPVEIVARIVDGNGQPRPSARVRVDFALAGETDPDMAWSFEHPEHTTPEGQLELTLPERIPESPIGSGASERMPTAARLFVSSGPDQAPTEVPLVLVPGEPVQLGEIVVR